MIFSKTANGLVNGLNGLSGYKNAESPVVSGRDSGTRND